MQADAKSSQPTILVESQISVTLKQTTSEERENSIVNLKVKEPIRGQRSKSNQSQYACFPLQ